MRMTMTTSTTATGMVTAMRTHWPNRSSWTRRAISPARDLADAFASMPAGVWRSKGFLTVDGEPSLLQFTMGQLEIGGAPARERPYLVVIGEDLDRPAVESALLAARMNEPE